MEVVRFERQVDAPNDDCLHAGARASSFELSGEGETPAFVTRARAGEARTRTAESAARGWFGPREEGAAPLPIGRLLTVSQLVA